MMSLSLMAAPWVGVTFLASVSVVVRGCYLLGQNAKRPGVQ